MTRPVIAFEKPPIRYELEGSPVSGRAAKKIRARLRCALPHPGLHELELDEPRMRAICRGCGETYPAARAHKKVGRGPIGAVVAGLTLTRIL